MTNTNETYSQGVIYVERKTPIIRDGKVVGYSYGSLYASPRRISSRKESLTPPQPQINNS